MCVEAIDFCGWAFIPGPRRFREPLYSTRMDELAEYSPDAVAQALISITKMRLVRPADPTWWDWKACWEDDGGILELGMTLCEPDDARVCWGGSGIDGRCPAVGLLRLWEAIRAKLDAVWLRSPDCRVYTPRSFRREVCGVET